MLLQNSGGEHIAVYCLLDSDYHTIAQKTTRRGQANRNQINLHIWAKKEIENYLLVPSAIQRLVVDRVARRVLPPTEVEIAEKINSLATNRYDEVFDGISAELLAEDRGLGAAGANRATRELLDPVWATPAGRQGLVSGKQVLSGLFKWIQDEFGVSLTAAAVIRTMRHTEVHQEVREFLEAVIAGRSIA
jgi:hypothetical protein